MERDLEEYCGEGNVPTDADERLMVIKEMYKTKNTKVFSEKKFKKSPHLFRSPKVLQSEGGSNFDSDASRWNEGVVPLSEKKRKYKYRGQGGLHPQQEWLLFLCKLHHDVPNSFLAERWLNCPCKNCCRTIRSIIQTWTSAMYSILRLENFWIDPDALEVVNERLGKEGTDIPALFRADCSCTPVQGHKGGSKGRSREASNGLWGHYYHVHGAKWCIIIGPNGSILGVSTTFGAGTSDRQIMHHMNLFDKKAYKRNGCTCSDGSCDRCKKPIPFYYDCAAFSMTSDFLEETDLTDDIRAQKRNQEHARTIQQAQ